SFTQAGNGDVEGFLDHQARLVQPYAGEVRSAEPLGVVGASEEYLGTGFQAASRRSRFLEVCQVQHVQAARDVQDGAELRVGQNGIGRRLDEVSTFGLSASDQVVAADKRLADATATAEGTVERLTAAEVHLSPVQYNPPLGDCR